MKKEFKSVLTKNNLSLPIIYHTTTIITRKIENIVRDRVGESEPVKPLKRAPRRRESRSWNPGLFKGIRSRSR